MSAPQSGTDRIVGNYKLGAKIGEGGQGSVLRASPLGGGPDVAFKLYILPLDEKEQARMRKYVAREVEALQSLSHPHVVRVVDTGELLEPGPYFVGWAWVAFELVDGKDLAHMMRLQAPEPSKLLVTISSIADGLESVHKRKLCHRDVKPANVILRGRKWDAPVLVDFGTVRPETASTLTRTEYSPGTPGYIAPELSSARAKATAASDQWSFARLTAELLLWSKGEDIDELRRSRDLVADVQDAFDDWTAMAEVFEQALDSEPELRFDSVSGFATAIEEAMYEDGLLDRDPDAAQFDGVHWDKRRSLKSYIESLGFATIDNRFSGGALWVVASEAAFESVRRYLWSRNVQFQFAPSGGRASQNQPAWYTKAPD